MYLALMIQSTLGHGSLSWLLAPIYFSAQASPPSFCFAQGGGGIREKYMGPGANKLKKKELMLMF